jgi:hypothetical protein
MTFDELTAILRTHANQTFGVGASEQEIRVAEKELRTPITGSYRKFLREFGWGGVGHLELFGLGSDVPRHLDLVATTLSERCEMLPLLPQHFIPIMNDGAGNLYCLGERCHGDEPQIVFWDHSLGQDQEPEVVSIAFTEWLASQLANVST